MLRECATTPHIATHPGGHDPSLNVGDIVLGKRTVNIGNLKAPPRGAGVAMGGEVFELFHASCLFCMEIC